LDWGGEVSALLTLTGQLAGRLRDSTVFQYLKRAPGREFSPAWSPASEGTSSKSLLRNTSSPLSGCK